LETEDSLLAKVVNENPLVKRKEKVYLSLILLQELDCILELQLSRWTLQRSLTFMKI